MKVDPLDYFEEILSLDKACLELELTAHFTFDLQHGWTNTWDTRMSHDDEHAEYELCRNYDNLRDVIIVYLEDVSQTFWLNTDKKIHLRLYSANFFQDVWRYEYTIERESLWRALWRWMKE